LSNYLPADAAPVIARWIDYFNCEFKISRNRSTKHGDYRHPFKDAGHRISVNYNLNPYAFLITTVHEFAHLLTWNEHKRKAKPHGQEWKNNFKKMMRPFFEQAIFPPDIRQAISVEKLVINALFSIKGGRVFRKESLVRKRYRCVEIKTGAVYLFPPLAEVSIVGES